jgi:hypothetical protein
VFVFLAAAATDRGQVSSLESLFAGNVEHHPAAYAQREPIALPELDISAIMRLSLENALQRGRIQGSDQDDGDGLTGETIA